MSPPQQPQNASPGNDTILGLSTQDLVGISVDELKNNETAIKMMMHYYKVLQDDNSRLKNENTTLTTYRDAYTRQSTASKVAGWLSLVGSVFVGIGTGIIVSEDHSIAGWAVLGAGLLAEGISVYFSLKRGS